MCPPYRDLCDVHTSEKCVSDFTRGGEHTPVQLNWTCMLLATCLYISVPNCR